MRKGTRFNLTIGRLSRCLKKSICFVVFVTSWFIVCTRANARLTRAQIDTFVQPAIDMGDCDGIVVGFVDRDGRQVFGYGLTAPGGKTPDGKTVFEIGSITKVFTALLLAEDVRSGRVRLDERIKNLLPPGTTMPAGGGDRITLLDLTDQHSGLPRMPPDFEPAKSSDPYADFTPTKLYQALSDTKLTSAPGKKYGYSNYGVGLLGFALARQAHRSYEDLLVERICKPLGMHDTRITLNESLKSRLAVGRPRENWNFDALAGAGAIRSTADDLLTFLAANAGLRDSPLSSAMAMTHQRRASADAGSDIAMGWFIGKSTGALWHNGQTGGYHSFAGFVPDKFAIVVLGNTAGPTVDRIGSGLIRTALGMPAEPI